MSQSWNLTIDLSVWNVRNTSFNRVLDLMPSCKGGAQNLISSIWVWQPGQSKDCVCLSESWMVGWAPTGLVKNKKMRVYASARSSRKHICNPAAIFQQGCWVPQTWFHPILRSGPRGLGENNSLGIHRLTTSRGFTPSPMAPMCNWRPTVCQSPYRATC